MANEVEIRRWGNSLGIILPKEVVQQKGLKEKDRVIIEIVNPAVFRSLWGTLKTKKTAQQLKDMAREGWE